MLVYSSMSTSTTAAQRQAPFPRYLTVDVLSHAAEYTVLLISSAGSVMVLPWVASGLYPFRIYIYTHIDILVLASMHSESFKYIPDAHIIAAYPQQHFLQTMLSQLSAAWFSSNISQAKKNKENHMALQNPLSVCPWAFVKIHVYTPKNQKKAILVGKPLVFLVSCTRFMDNPMSRVCIDQS